MTALGIAVGLWGVLGYKAFLDWLKFKTPNKVEIDSLTAQEIKRLNDRINSVELAMGLQVRRG